MASNICFVFHPTSTSPLNTTTAIQASTNLRPIRSYHLYQQSLQSCSRASHWSDSTRNCFVWGIVGGRSRIGTATKLSWMFQSNDVLSDSGTKVVRTIGQFRSCVFDSRAVLQCYVLFRTLYWNRHCCCYPTPSKVPEHGARPLGALESGQLF